jgi:hypothetical protein
MEMVGDHENLKKTQFLIYFFFVFVLFLLFARYDLWCVVLHGLTSFNVDLCDVLRYVWMMCIMKGQTKLHKGRCLRCWGGGLTKFIATILLLWGS